MQTLGQKLLLCPVICDLVKFQMRRVVARKAHLHIPTLPEQTNTQLSLFLAARVSPPFLPSSLQHPPAPHVFFMLHLDQVSHLANLKKIIRDTQRARQSQIMFRFAFRGSAGSYCWMKIPSSRSTPSGALVITTNLPGPTDCACAWHRAHEAFADHLAFCLAIFWRRKLRGL